MPCPSDEEEEAVQETIINVSERTWARWQMMFIMPMFFTSLLCRNADPHRAERSRHASHDGRIASVGEQWLV